MQNFSRFLLGYRKLVKFGPVYCAAFGVSDGLLDAIIQLSPSVNPSPVPSLPTPLHQGNDVWRDPGLVEGPETRALDGEELLVPGTQQTLQGLGSFVGVVHAQDVLPALTRDPLPELANGGVAEGPVFAD